MTQTEIYSLVLALLSAGAAGLVGSFALMKKMSLAGDVVAHIALPGLAAAILLKINPIIGGAFTLFLGILLIWQIERKSTLYSDTAIGVVFTAALAIGALITPQEDLIEALFGGLNEITPMSFAFGVLAAILVSGGIILLRHKLILSLFSKDLAATSGVNVDRVQLIYLLIFGLAILLGLQFLGAILVGALIITPAAAGRELSKTLNGFLISSALVGMLSVLVGYFLSRQYNLELGPLVVAVAAVFFGLSLLFKRT